MFGIWNSITSLGLGGFFLVIWFYFYLRIEPNDLQNNVVFPERQKNSMRITSVFQNKFLKLCNNNSFAEEWGICAVIHASEVIVLVRMFVHAATLWQVHIQYPKLGWAVEDLSSKLQFLKLCVK